MGRGRAASLNVRWTIGNVSSAGFEALRLSIHGAARLLGAKTNLVVCVNTITVEEARERTGTVLAHVEWRAVKRELPPVLRPFLDGGMSQGTAWKFVPLQLDSGVRELALDNDVILWTLPSALRRWLDDQSGSSRLIAADVTPAHGQFAHLCGSEPRNSGIRGTPAGFDLAKKIADVLADHPAPLRSELDEQGLQIAALSKDSPPDAIGTDDVTICSPFPPHQPQLGRCGAHFVGLNAHCIPWDYDGRPATEVRLEHWKRHRPELYRRVGLDWASSPYHAPEDAETC
ncbi:MAG: hypothetical protein JWM91_3351 [Rhodospirillales bacterium]|nr:hypothetical protein [Rhodospirillales bacterium]